MHSPAAFAVTQAAVEAARQAFDSLPRGSSDEQNLPFHERLADAEDAAVAELIATPARSENELDFKLDALRTLLDDGVWTDRRELRLAASITDDARALGLISHSIRSAT